MNLEKGYVDAPINPDLDIVAEIRRMCAEKNAVILAHYYQDSKIQDIADFVGDSLDLSRKAAETTADVIVFAGVHFMAETAKILSPHKVVLLPDLNAGCSLADSCPPAEFKIFREKHSDHLVVSYVNTTAAIKALSDICCTSTNAVDVIESLPKDQAIIFAPDRNLGKYINSLTGRNMLVWDGACHVHEEFSLERILDLKKDYPDLIKSHVGALELMYADQCLDHTGEKGENCLMLATLPLYMGDGGNFERTFCCYGNDVDCSRCGAYSVFNTAWHRRTKGEDDYFHRTRHQPRLGLSDNHH